MTTHPTDAERPHHDVHGARDDPGLCRTHRIAVLRYRSILQFLLLDYCMKDELVHCVRSN